MATKFVGVGEPSADYAVAMDYEHERRDAEHEYETALLDQLPASVRD